MREKNTSLRTRVGDRALRTERLQPKLLRTGWPWVVAVRDGDDSGTSDIVPAQVPADSALAKSNVPADVPAATANEFNERQQWALHQLDIGVRLQRVMLEHKFSVGEKAAKRDLATLSRRGLVKFVRQGRDGCYELANHKK